MNAKNIEELFQTTNRKREEGMQTRWTQSRMILLLLAILLLYLPTVAFGWGTDILVKDELDQTDIDPHMVATSTMGLFLVRDNKENHCMDILRSINGGATWSQFTWYCDAEYQNILKPRIAIPEKTQDYVYVVFTSGSLVKLLKIKMDDPYPSQHHTYVMGEGTHPMIITNDKEHSPNYSLYVSYIQRNPLNGSIDNVLERSNDKGSAWVSRTLNGLTEYNYGFICGDHSETDIAYYDHHLYWGTICGEDVNKLYLFRIDDIVSNTIKLEYEHVDTDIDKYKSDIRIAVNNYDEPAITYLSYYASDYYVVKELIFAVKNSWAFSYSKSVLEASPDIAYPEIAYLGGRYYIAYSHIGYLDPDFIKYFFVENNVISQMYVVSESGKVREDSRLTIAVDPNGNTPVIAWSDHRTPTSAIYCDRNPLPDLVVQDIVVDPVSPVVGQNVTVTVTVKNQGGAAVQNYFNVDIYKNRTAPPVASEYGDAFCGTSGLAIGATFSCVKTVNYSTNETFLMWAQVDSDQFIVEGNERNNVFGPRGITVLPPLVTVTAPDATAAENPLDTGYFKISLGAPLTTPLTVNFGMTGTATKNSDYVRSLTPKLLYFPVSVTIPAGSTSVNLPLTPVNDTVCEPKIESAILTLTANAAYVIGAQSSATISISSDAADCLPVVSVSSALDSSASELPMKPLDQGNFRISRTVTAAAPLSQSLTVSFTMGGTALKDTDYTLAFTSPVTIPANQYYLDIPLTAINDSICEQPSEKATLTLTAGATYKLGSSRSADVTILNDEDCSLQLPTVTVTASDPTATEAGPTRGAFQITRAGSWLLPLTVSISMGGSATNGTDYEPIALTQTIPAGSASVNVYLTPLDDITCEPSEAATMTLVANAGYIIGASASATVNFEEEADCSKPQILMDNGALTESWGGRSYTGSWAVSTSATTTPYRENSVYSTAAGSTYRWTPTIQTEGKYEVWAHWTKAANRSTSVPYTVRYVDEATNSYTTVVVTKDQRNTGENWPEMVSLGTYKFHPGTGGYVEVKGGPYIPAPSQQASADAVMFVPTAPSALPIVTITASDPKAAENPLDTGKFTLIRSSGFGSALTVNYSVAGSATPGVDYVPLSGNVSFYASSTIASITVTPVNDTDVENAETVQVTLSPNPAYTVGTPDNATVTIASDDGVEILIDNLPEGAQSPGGIPVSYTGTWKTSTRYTTTPYGADSLYSDAANSTYRWTPNIQVEGRYEVWVHWTKYTNRSTSVPYTVRYVDEATNSYTTVEVRKDQNTIGGNWPEMESLGTYKFLPGTGGYVEVKGGSYTATPSQQASADAVKFVLVP